MAVRALHRCVFVDDYDLFAHQLRLRMALRAGHLRMPAGQREPRLIVVKRRRYPLLNIVAVRAMGLPVLRHKLSFVEIDVARLALLRRALESRLIRRRRLVTISARHGAMRAHQRELRLRMVKPVDIRPRPRVVASLAAKRRPVSSSPCHPVVKLPFVRILVAGRARAILEVERQNLVRSPA